MINKINFLIYPSLLMGVLLFFTNSCKKDDNNNNGRGTFTDPRDGKVYRTVTIDTQVWMAENLGYLPYMRDTGSGSGTKPFYYVYEYKGTSAADAKAIVNYTTYGVLYNWEAAKTACPAGWHLPSDAEWTQLTTYLGGDSVAGGRLKESGTAHWISPNTGATDETGFTALPGGCHYFNGLYSLFDNIGSYGFWWCATEASAIEVWYRSMSCDRSVVNRSKNFKDIEISVRCVKD